MSCLWGLVNNLSADHRHHAARFQYFRFRNLHDIGGQHREVAELAWFDRAFYCLLKSRVSRPKGEHFQGLRAGDRLLGVPACAREAFHVLTGNRRIKLDHRLAALDWRIRPAGDDRAAFEKASPRVSPGQTLEAKPARGEVQ